MHKGRTVINLPVIDLSCGEQLGEVLGVLWDGKTKVTGLLVACSGKEKCASVIPLMLLNSIGKDAVIVKDKSWDDLLTDPEECKTVDIFGRRVVTEGGQELGTIQDIIFEFPTGMVSGFEISDGLIKDLVAGRGILSSAAIVTWGDEAVVVSDSRVCLAEGK